MKLTLNNFQNHVHTELDLNPGVNIILGRSDAGKSAIIRALLWVIFNKPAGKSFIRKNALMAKVIFDTDNNSITRVRDSRGEQNSYLLDGEPLKAFGRDVPEQISALLNMDELNIQTQHKPLFLISEIGSDIAKFINKIVDLEKIDSSVANINSLKKQSVKETKQTEVELQRMQAELASLSWIDECVELHKQLQEQQIAHTDLIRQKIKIVNALQQLGAAIQLQQRQAEIIKCKSAYEKYQKLTQNLTKQQQKKQILANLLTTRTTQLTNLERLRSVIRQRPAVQRAQATHETYAKLVLNKNLIMVKTKQLSTQRARLVKITILLENKTSALELHKRLSTLKEYEWAKQQVNNALKAIKQQQEKKVACRQKIEELQKTKPQTCPTCGQPWPVQS